jgi:transcriptional regulator with XRE-family HTH domain
MSKTHQHQAGDNDMSTELDPNAVAHNVRHYRFAKGWTQGVLAEAMTAAGCPTSLKQISNTEINMRRVNAEQLLAFAQVFEVPMEELFKVRVVTELDNLVTEMLCYSEDHKASGDGLNYAIVRVHEEIRKTSLAEGVSFSKVVERITSRPGIDMQLLLSVQKERWVR